MNTNDIVARANKLMFQLVWLCSLEIEQARLILLSKSFIKPLFSNANAYWLGRFPNHSKQSRQIVIEKTLIK